MKLSDFVRFLPARCFSKCSIRFSSHSSVLTAFFLLSRWDWNVKGRKQTAVETAAGHIRVAAANPVDRHGVCSELLAAQPSTISSYTACDAKRC